MLMKKTTKPVVQKMPVRQASKFSNLRQETLHNLPTLTPTPRMPLVQRSATIGQSTNQHEYDADAIAGQVLQQDALGMSQASPDSRSTTGTARDTSGSHFLKAGGQPLSGDERSYFEPRFGHNFGNVRVHREQEDNLLADSLQAQAFTFGNHIYLGSQNRQAGRHLMAHELAHVSQQHAGVNLRSATWLERRAWLSFFDHYLPRKFLNNYMDDTGTAITLSRQEMMDCNPIVDLHRSRGLMNDVASLRASGGGSKTSNWSGWGGAMTNGTLGNFTIRYQGTLTVNPDGTWHFNGSMTFYDYWDFNTGGSNRPLGAELKVRVANTFLPGQPFHIYSQQVNVSQSSNASRASWNASAPTHVPDNARRTGADIAVGDVGGGEVGAEAGAQASEDLN